MSVRNKQYTNINHKNTGQSVLISEKAASKVKDITVYYERHCIIRKEESFQESKTTILM